MQKLTLMAVVFSLAQALTSTVVGDTARRTAHENSNYTVVIAVLCLHSATYMQKLVLVAKLSALHLLAALRIESG